MKYKLGDVVRLTGIREHRIRYAERHGQVSTGRHRRYAHRWYEVAEVDEICRWFGVPFPVEIKRRGTTPTI